MDDLLHPETAARLELARQGQDVAVPLRIGSLQVGQSGLLRAKVEQLSPVRSFRRKDGRDGVMARATLDDGTGSVELVLWGDETRLLGDGTLVPGGHVEFQGPTVKAGYRGGIELALGSGQIQPIAAPSEQTFTGKLEAIEDTQIIDDRFQAQARMLVDGASITVILWDEDVKTIRLAGPGASVLVTAAPHPLLDGHWLASTVTVI